MSQNNTKEYNRYLEDWQKHRIGIFLGYETWQASLELTGKKIGERVKKTLQRLI